LEEGADAACTSAVFAGDRLGGVRWDDAEFDVDAAGAIGDLDWVWLGGSAVRCQAVVKHAEEENDACADGDAADEGALADYHLDMWTGCLLNFRRVLKWLRMDLVLLV
jgi:hypothetical protein